MMFVNPQLDADMTRIGARVCGGENCWMCQTCVNTNGLRCYHNDRWKAKKERLTAHRRKQHQALKKHYAKLSPEQREIEHAEDLRRGGYRGCESGYRDDGATCFRDLHCDTSCSGDWRPWTWHCDTHCSGPDMYGKYDDEFVGAFLAVGNFFKNLPSQIMDAFKPDGPLAHMFDPNLNGVADGLRKAGDAIKSGLEQAFDPEKNGVASAMRKFGKDIEGGFEAMGKTLTDAFSAESMNRAFGPMVAAFNSFGDAMNSYFSDPSNILGFVCMCMSTIAAVLPPPFSQCLSVLAACTEMIGNACLGKPFDPMCLLDLGMALACPQAKLAGTIAKTTAKATTIIGKLTKTATSATKSVMKQAREGVKKLSTMSTKDKALVAGKTLAKITGKLGTDVMMNNPVESQQTPSQRQEDESIGQDWLEDSQDPQRQENSDELQKELDKEEYEQALKEERDAGQITGEYKKPREEAKTAKKTQMVREETEPDLVEMTKKATNKPRSYPRDEKIFFYKNSTQAAREAQLAANAKAKADAELQKAVNDARLTKGKSEKQIVDDKRWADRQIFKSDNEKRKYGFTYEEAVERLKLYKIEQEKFATATGKVPKKDLHPPKRKADALEGGTNLVDEPPPDFMMADVEDRGEGDFGQAPYLPPIFTPTFFHFVKEKFSKIPELSNPEDWFPEFNKFWTCYDKQKKAYKKLIETNKIALDARSKMTMAEKDRAYQEWLSSDFAAESPINLAVAAKAEGKQAFLEFIRNQGFTEKSWNAQMKTLARDDLMIDVTPETPRDPPPKPTIPSSDKVFKVPDADPAEVTDDELTGGAVDTPLIQPKMEDAMAYFKYKLVRENPLNQYSDMDVRQAYEQAWEQKPQETLAAINQFKMSPPQPVIGKGRKTKARRRSISGFFGLRGGEEDTSGWYTPGADETPTEGASPTEHVVDAEGVAKKKTERHTDIKNVLDAEAHEQMATELWQTDLPASLQKYLAASPEKKRETRGELQAFREWGKGEYGIPTEADAWFQIYKDFEKDVEDKAPELNGEGVDINIPQKAFEETDEGKADVALHAETSQAARDAKNAEDKALALAKEFEEQTAEEAKLYADWKKTFDEEWKAASEAQDEEALSAAIEKFNGHFPEGDRRRLSGSGKPKPTLVLKNLWLGNRDDAGNKAWLKRHKIHKVFNVTPDVEDAPHGETVRFSINDSHEDADKMVEHGLDWADQIMDAMDDGPVLVHCREGRQRSATLVALVMGLKHPAKLHTIIKKLQAKRPIALTPYPTFAKALKKWFY